MNKFHNWEGFFYILVILMPVVVERDKITIIMVNARGSDNRPTEIATNIVYDNFWVTLIRFGIDVESVFMLLVTTGLYFLKGCPNLSFQKIEQDGSEGIAEESVVKIIDITPKAVITVAALRDEAVDVRIPF
jgi:hypothetical protein